MALLYNIIAMLIFGTIGLFAKEASISSGLLAFLRTVIGAIMLGMVLLIRHQQIHIEKGQGKYLLLSALFLGCNWVFLFESYRYTSISNATIAYYTAPILITLCSIVLFHSRLTLRTVICLIITMTGLICITFQEGSFDGIGIFFGLLAAAGYAGIVLTNQWIHMDSIVFTFLQLLMAALILCPYVWIRGEFTQLSMLTMHQIPYILIMGIVHTGIAYLLYFTSIAKLAPSTAAIFSYIDPCTAILLSIVLLQEKSSLLQMTGIFCILTGILLSTHKTKRGEHMLDHG